jgi:spore maturation protein CgeB
MRILYIAPCIPYCDQIGRALEKAGNEVIRIDDRQNRLFGGLLLWKVVRSISVLKRMNNRLLSKAILKAARDSRPDVMLAIKGMSIKPHVLATLKEMNIITANWFMDNFQDQHYSSWLKNNSKRFDHFFMFDSLGAAELGAHYLPLGIDSDLYRSELSDQTHIKTNICFVGAWDDKREKYLNQIKDLGLKIYGWPQWEKTSLAQFYQGPLKPKDFISLYKQSKICINLNTEPPVNGVNLRTFEILAAGGFELTDYRKDIEDLFVIDQEITIFKSPEDLRSKVEYFLAHEEERRNIIDKGRTRILREHTLDHRLRELLSKING